MNKRIFVCGLLQESNSFNPVLSTFEDFVGAGIYEGDALVRAGERAGATIHGMLNCIKDTGCEAVGGVRRDRFSSRCYTIRGV